MERWLKKYSTPTMGKTRVFGSSLFQTDPKSSGVPWTVSVLWNLIDILRGRGAQVPVEAFWEAKATQLSSFVAAAFRQATIQKLRGFPGERRVIGSSTLGSLRGE